MSAAAALLLLAGCHHRAPTAVDPTLLHAADALVVAEANRAAGLVPVLAKFNLQLQSPKDAVSAQGVLLVSPPDRFRIEISGPIGPPALVIASDGTAVNALLPGKGIFYAGPDAEAALRGLTGGAAGLDVVTALLVGQFVLPGPAGPEAAVSGGWQWSWTREDGTRLSETLGAVGGKLVALDVTKADGAALLAADLVPTPGSPWPASMHVELAPLGTTADVRFSSWQAATPGATAFTLTAPEGAEVRELSAVGRAEP